MSDASPAPVRIRRMVVADLPEAVRVHLESFPAFFLSLLGPGCLRELYRSFVVDPSGVALVAEDPASSRVIGVIAGTTRPAGHFRRLLARRWWAFGLTCLRAALRRPGIIPRLLRGLCYRGGDPDSRALALLSTLAVSPSAQHRGVGSALVRRWVEAVRSDRSLAGCFLTTDGERNDAVNHFYRSAGWSLDGRYVTPEGRTMNRYTYEFMISA